MRRPLPPAGRRPAAPTNDFHWVGPAPPSPAVADRSRDCIMMQSRYDQMIAGRRVSATPSQPPRQAASAQGGRGGGWPLAVARPPPSSATPPSASQRSLALAAAATATALAISPLRSTPQRGSGAAAARGPRPAATITSAWPASREWARRSSGGSAGAGGAGSGPASSPAGTGRLGGGLDPGAIRARILLRADDGSAPPPPVFGHGACREVDAGRRRGSGGCGPSLTSSGDGGGGRPRRRDAMRRRREARVAAQAARWAERERMRWVHTERRHWAAFGSIDRSRLLPPADAPGSGGEAAGPSVGSPHGPRRRELGAARAATSEDSDELRPERRRRGAEAAPAVQRRRRRRRREARAAAARAEAAEGGTIDAQVEVGVGIW